MRYRYLFFDLDGTLIDSTPGVVRCAREALTKRGYRIERVRLEKTLIGPPLYEGLGRLLPEAPEALLRKMVEDFRSCYRAGGVLQNRLYPGIERLLKKLAAEAELVLLTSKPQVFAETILRQHGIGEFFSLVDGAGEGDRSSRKADKLAAYCAGKEEQSVMIGDRAEDILAARRAGIDAVAVSYGFGSPEELRKAQPAQQVDTVKELEEVLYATA